MNHHEFVLATRSHLEAEEDDDGTIVQTWIAKVTAECIGEDGAVVLVSMECPEVGIEAGELICECGDIIPAEDVEMIR